MAVINNIKDSDSFKELGGFGRYHVLQYFWICIPLFMVSMTHVNYIFVAEDIDHRCRIPECENENPSIETPDWWPIDADAKCFRPVLNIDAYNAQNGTCSNTTFLNILEECHEWVYKTNDSIVAALNLGCQPWKASLVGSVHNAGMIVSMMFTGWIGDKFGRKPTIILCSVGGAIGAIKVFLTNYYAYLTIEFLESLLASGLYTVAVVLLIEVGGETKRVLAGVIFSYAVYVGEIVFALIAMGLRYWKSVILVVYTPMTLFILYGFVLRESTRWQMLCGKTKEAKVSFMSIARMNNIKISPKELAEMNDDELKIKLNICVQYKKENIQDAMRSNKMMVRLAVTSVCFFTSSLLYYGSMINSVLLPGDKYTNFVLAALTSFPGDMLAFYTFNKFGRRITLQCGYFSSAIFFIAQNYAPDSMSWLKIFLFLCGKLGVVVCFTGIYTYSLELFPTSVRGTLVGCGNTAARVGSMLAPLTPLLVKQMTMLPSIIFAASATLSGLLLIFTPESKALPLFDTIAQVEAYKPKYQKP